MWKEAAVAYFKVPVPYVGGLGKTTIHLRIVSLRSKSQIRGKEFSIQ